MRLARPLAIALALTVAAPAFAEDAKTQLAAGDKAAHAKDWAAAKAAYDAANKAQPSAAALEGLANARYELHDDGEAYAAYEELQRKYKLAPAKKTQIAARLKDLDTKTGILTLTVNEAGAAIYVDDKPVGSSPVTPLHLAIGPHRVRVTKEGFLPFDQAPSVAPGPAVAVVVTLSPASAKSRLSVREKMGQAVRVIVDGVDVGDAPWTGDLDAGPHEVVLKGAGLVSTPEKITLERGKSRELAVVATASSAPIKVATNDGKGLLFVDDKLVGEGSFSGVLPAGAHHLKVTRDGYDPFEEDVVLKDKEPLARTITLKLSSKIETGPVEKPTRPLEGLYGGFAFIGAIGLGGTKSSMQKTCDDSRPAEVASCDGGSDLGGGLSGFLGYHWDPVGVELYAAGTYDQQSPSIVWNASSVDPGLGPDPARTEDFAVRRAAFFGAARVRLTLQGERVRFSVAGGVGLAYRAMFITRGTRDTANADVRSAYVSDALTYLSPALSLEPTIQYRLSPGVAVSLGLALTIDNPGTFGDIPATKADGSQHLGASGLSTPAYQAASGTQVFLGPSLGMMFGP